MKTKNSIAHYTGREQHALRYITNRIVTACKPLLIYCFRSSFLEITERHCFAATKNNSSWTVDCGMLVVLADDGMHTDALDEESSSSINPYGKIDLRMHPLSFVAEQLKDRSIFFSWVQRSAILLFEKANSSQLLPAAVKSTNEYREQAKQLYAADPDLRNSMDKKLVPVANSTQKKAPDKTICFELRMQLIEQ